MLKKTNRTISILSLATLAFAIHMHTITAAENRSGASGPAALWDIFADNLRKGNFKSAYNCFSPSSQNVFAYQEFLKHYNPMMAAYEATLSPIDQGRLQISGDLAKLSFVADLGATEGRSGVLVSALMVREEERWFLVAAKREKLTRIEAIGRSLLRKLWHERESLRNLSGGGKMSTPVIMQAATKLFSTNTNAICPNYYDIEADFGAALPVIRITPKKKGLRTFHITTDGVAHESLSGSTAPIQTLTGNNAHKEQNTIAIPAPPPDMGDPEELSVPLPARQIPTIPYDLTVNREKFTESEFPPPPALPDNEQDTEPTAINREATDSPQAAILPDSTQEKGRQNNPIRTDLNNIPIPQNELPPPPPESADPESGISPIETTANEEIISQKEENSAHPSDNLPNLELPELPTLDNNKLTVPANKIEPDIN